VGVGVGVHTHKSMHAQATHLGRHLQTTLHPH
jgi:hypothetical protein